MSSIHQFGGNWTEEKLRRLEKYLAAYTKIFQANRWAQRYTTYYVDAFAGTGRRTEAELQDSTLSLFDDNDTLDVTRFYRGSARIALEIDPGFDQFMFIDTNLQHIEELGVLKNEYPNKAASIDIRHGDANDVLLEWINDTDWTRTRAVVFLDPYGMSVDWTTIQALALTKAIDLWVLLPVGQAINRLLTRKGVPDGPWADKLTRFFGNEQWKQEFYRPRLQASLFDELTSEYEKTATFESISDFFIKRLSEEFVEVAKDSLVLLNSKNNPLFVLFFAASNPRGAPTAVKIAGDILRAS